MKKPLIIVAIVLLLAAISLLFIGFLLNQSKNQAEQQSRNDNPIFHTVQEGGVCRPDMGDCQTGLTCNGGICEKP